MQNLSLDCIYWLVFFLLSALLFLCACWINSFRHLLQLPLFTHWRGGAPTHWACCLHMIQTTFEWVARSDVEQRSSLGPNHLLSLLIGKPSSAFFLWNFIPLKCLIFSLISLCFLSGHCLIFGFFNKPSMPHYVVCLCWTAISSLTPACIDNLWAIRLFVKKNQYVIECNLPLTLE